MNSKRLGILHQNICAVLSYTHVEHPLPYGILIRRDPNQTLHIECSWLAAWRYYGEAVHMAGHSTKKIKKVVRENSRKRQDAV